MATSSPVLTLLLDEALKARDHAVLAAGLPSLRAFYQKDQASQKLLLEIVRALSQQPAFLEVATENAVFVLRQQEIDPALEQEMVNIWLKRVNGISDPVKRFELVSKGTHEFPANSRLRKEMVEIMLRELESVPAEKRYSVAWSAAWYAGDAHQQRRALAALKQQMAVITDPAVRKGKIKDQLYKASDRYPALKAQILETVLDNLAIFPADERLSIVDRILKAAAETPQEERAIAAFIAETKGFPTADEAVKHAFSGLYTYAKKTAVREPLLAIIHENLEGLPTLERRISTAWSASTWAYNHDSPYHAQFVAAWEKYMKQPLAAEERIKSALDVMMHHQADKKMKEASAEVILANYQGEADVGRRIFVLGVGMHYVPATSPLYAKLNTAWSEQVRALPDVHKRLSTAWEEAQYPRDSQPQALAEWSQHLATLPTVRERVLVSGDIFNAVQYDESEWPRKETVAGKYVGEEFARQIAALPTSQERVDAVVATACFTDPRHYRKCHFLAELWQEQVAALRTPEERVQAAKLVTRDAEDPLSLSKILLKHTASASPARRVAAAMVSGNAAQALWRVAVTVLVDNVEQLASRDERIAHAAIAVGYAAKAGHHYTAAKALQARVTAPVLCAA